MEISSHPSEPRRQWLNDVEDWIGYKYIQLKEMSVDREHMEEEDTGMVSCWRQPSEEEGRLETDK